MFAVRRRRLTILLCHRPIWRLAGRRGCGVLFSRTLKKWFPWLRAQVVCRMHKPDVISVATVKIQARQNFRNTESVADGKIGHDTCGEMASAYSR